jgi:F-type H+-transporting ATPase subunit a
MAEGHDHNPLSHVLDSPRLEVPWTGAEVHLPSIAGVQVTKLMVMETVVAVLMIAILVPLARHVAKNRVSKGRFWNAFEAMVVFIRNGIARPAIDGSGGHGHGDDHGHGGDHGHGHAVAVPHRRLSDQYLPFLWTTFFFVLFGNLLGMIPGGASSTGNINVTGILALPTFGAVLLAGSKEQGPVKFWTSLVPKMDLPPFLKPILWVMLFFIEIAGLLIRHVVLAVRLFANMFAGHIVLTVILGFTMMAVGWLYWVVTPASILGVVVLSLLELFVAFLQAYIFTFLAALFIGTAAHPH